MEITQYVNDIFTLLFAKGLTVGFIIGLTAFLLGLTLSFTYKLLKN